MCNSSASPNLSGRSCLHESARQKKGWGSARSWAICLRKQALKHGVRDCEWRVWTVTLLRRIFSTCGRVDKSLTRLAPLRTGRAAFPHPALCKTYYSATILHIRLHKFLALLTDILLTCRWIPPNYNSSSGFFGSAIWTGSASCGIGNCSDFDCYPLFSSSGNIQQVSHSSSL